MGKLAFLALWASKVENTSGATSPPVIDRMTLSILMLVVGTALFVGGVYDRRHPGKYGGLPFMATPGYAALYGGGILMCVGFLLLLIELVRYLIH